MALIVGPAIYYCFGAASTGWKLQTIVLVSASPKKRPQFTGIVGTVYGIAAVVGPLLAGTIADKVA